MAFTFIKCLIVAAIQIFIFAIFVNIGFKSPTLEHHVFQKSKDLINSHGLTEHDVSFQNKTDYNLSNIDKNLIGITQFPNLKEYFKTVAMPQGNTKINNWLTKEEYDSTFELLRQVNTILNNHNITTILTYGSLIGSYLMHDMLPWDDDVDIFIHNDSKAKVIDLFQKGYQGIVGYHHTQHIGSMVKLFFDASKPAGKYPWKWPYIEVLSYVDKGDYIVPVERRIKFKVAKSDFYPFHMRPFGPLWMLAPRKPAAFLTPKYGQFKCKSGSWDHKNEIRTKSQHDQCKNLVNTVPFVRRIEKENRTIEELVFNSITLYEININAKFGKQQSMFSW